MATTTNTDETLADQIAMALGGGLMILGVVVLGAVEVFSGKPYSPIADGSVPAGVTVDPYIRALLITIGVVVLLLYAIYAFVFRGLLGQQSL
ncbi:MAG: hypothetical protein ABEI98_11960 [Halorhabdus sp.]